MDSKSIVGDNVWVQVPPSAPRASANADAFSIFVWDLMSGDWRLKIIKILKCNAVKLKGVFAQKRL